MEPNESAVLTTPKLLVRIGLRVVFVALLILFAFTGLGPVLRMFLPFIIGYAITALFISPLTRRIRRNSGRKIIAMAMVILITLVVLAIVGGVMYYVVYQIADLVKNWEAIKANFEVTLGDVIKFVSDFTGRPAEELNTEVLTILADLFSTLESALAKMFPDIAAGIGNAVPVIGRGLLAALFTVIATYFIAYDYNNIREKIAGAVPKLIRPHMNQIRSAANSAMFGYLRAQLIISSIIALISFVVLLIVGQPFAILIAIAIGCVDFVPLLGSSVVTIPWAIIVLIQSDFRMALILVALTFVLFMFRRITEPKIVGDQTGLHAVVSLICMYIGMLYGGVLGMILAPVICMVFVTLYRVGFFTPSIDDVRSLIYRVAGWLRGKHEPIPEDWGDAPEADKQDEEENKE